MSEAAPSERESRAISKETILSLYVPAIMLSLGSGIALPVLPAYAKSFHVDFATALLIIQVQPWGSVLSTLPTGYLIDKIGRKPVALIGPFLTAVSAFATAFAPSFAILVGIRFFNGMSAQMWQQSRLAMIADSGGARERGKLITWMTSMQRFGMLFSPAIGGAVAGIDIRAPFILQGILVLLSLIPNFFLIKETAPERKRNANDDSDWTYMRGELLKPQMLWFLGAQVFANLTRGNIGQILTFYMGFEYGKSPQSLGLISTFNSVLNIPIGFATGTIMDRYGRKKTVVPGFFGLFVSAIYLAWTAVSHATFGFFLVGFYMLNVSQGVTSGNMQVLGSDLAPARARGRFIGLWRLLAELGNALSPSLFQLFYIIGAAVSFTFVGSCALATSMIIAFRVKETVRSRSETLATVVPPTVPDATGPPPTAPPEPVGTGPPTAPP